MGESPAHADIRARLRAELEKIVDPDAIMINAQAFADQEVRTAAHGGPEVIKQRGDFGYTPAPGQTPVFG